MVTKGNLRTFGLTLVDKPSGALIAMVSVVEAPLITDASPTGGLVPQYLVKLLILKTLYLT